MIMKIDRQTHSRNSFAKLQRRRINNYRILRGKRDNNVIGSQNQETAP